MNTEMIEQVVKEVFEILAQRRIDQSNSSEVNSNDNNKSVTVTDTAVDTVVDTVNLICGDVITEDLLRLEYHGQNEMAFQPKAIITPSAKDFLRQNQIQWNLESHSPTENKTVSETSWKLFVVTPSEQIKTILKEINKKRNNAISMKVSADLNEAVSDSVSGICRAEMSSAIILTDSPEEAACLANRQAKIEAASVSSTKDVQRIYENWTPNLHCVMASGHSYFDFRNLLRSIVRN